MATLGWDQCDVIIVSGDAYVDHPAFGPAVISRVLLDAGFRVGIIAQPDWRGPEAVSALGRPRLFFGVTAGNVDSLVANYSPALQRRKTDDYSPGGRAGLRPNRATTVYSNLLRHAFPGVPLVLGGIEASLRRLAHYDYWEDTVRRSLLVDTRADILVYGMGEPAVVEIARRLAARDTPETAETARDMTELSSIRIASQARPPAVRVTPKVLADGALSGIPGTVIITHDPPASPHVLLPSYEDCAANPAKFNDAFRLWYHESANPAGKAVVQPHADRLVVQFPPPPPLAPAELDRIYDLPYTRRAHPSCREPVPALATVRFSITTHRGCLGTCSFCSLGAHQGRIIQWRSRESILREAKTIISLPGFKGHITDLGGPTANMYAATCPHMARGRICADRECTWPARCPSLKLAIGRELAVLEAVRTLPGVIKVSIGSGVRFDLLVATEPRSHTPETSYLDQLCEHYISGQLRIAPEHASDRVLAAMHKAPHRTYIEFRRRFADTNRRLGRKQYLIPYFISGHPGATIDDALSLAEHLVKVERFFIRQVQQFTPLPMTASAAAWHTGFDPLTGKPLHVARDPREIKLQRALLQLQEPRNYEFAEQELSRLGRADLARRLRALKPLLGRIDNRPGRTDTQT